MPGVEPTGIEKTEVRLLGPITVSTGGRDIDLGSPRQLALFATLAANSGRVVSREELVDAVWGIDAPATAINSVYTYVGRLRGALEPTRAQRAPAEMLLSEGSGYMLVLPPEHVDQRRFEAHLTEARRLHGAGALHGAVGELDGALALWRGTAYGGAAGPFVATERTRLSELRLVAQEDRAEILLKLGQHADLVGELFGLARRNPLRERLRLMLMQCYLRLGRQADVLTEYHDVRAVLADELGIEPSEELQELYQGILRREQHRQQVPAQRTAAPATAPTAPAAAAPAAISAAPAQLVRDVPGFTGRTAELRKLNDLVTAAQTTGESGVIVLSGGPGVGKSALAVHLGHTLARRFPDGQLHLDLHGFAHAARPMSPAASLRHLLAALGAPRTGSDDAEQQSALYRSLTARRRLFILLDNARSVEQVRPLLPGGSSSVIVVTSRNSLAGLAVRDGARRVTLDVMQEEEAISLFSRIVGQPFTAREYPVVRNVVAACARLPLALRIAAARINSAPSPKAAMADFTECNLFSSLDVPGDDQTSLRSVFDWSYRALPADAAQLFRALGTGTGAELTLQDAAELIEAGPRLVRHAMNTLVDANLVHEPLPDHFRMNTLIFAYARQLDQVGHLF